MSDSMPEESCRHCGGNSKIEFDDGSVARICSCRMINKVPFSEKLEKLISQISNLKIRHTQCEDGWYSCPLSEEGCRNERETECTCQAEDHNKLVDAILNQLTGSKDEH